MTTVSGNGCSYYQIYAEEAARAHAAAFALPPNVSIVCGSCAIPLGTVTMFDDPALSRRLFVTAWDSASAAACAPGAPTLHSALRFLPPADVMHPELCKNVNVNVRFM